MHKFSNKEIARILFEIAVYLEMDDIPFRPRAYEKVSENINTLNEEVFDIYQKHGLKAVEEIPGVGHGIAERIEELFKSGKMSDYEKLKKKMPVNVSELSAVEGIGPKSIKVLYKKLGVKSLFDLEKAAKSGKIHGLKGFGKKSEDKILKGIGFVKKSSGRFILGHVVAGVYKIKEKIAELKEVQKAEIAGSIRRGKETIGDADLLVISKNPKSIMDFFVGIPEVNRIIAKGETKSTVKLKSGLNVDMRVVPKGSYGAALNYFTGSKDHNVALREIAIKKGWKLNEYGLFKGNKQIAGKTEEDLYEKLGMQYIPPELREMTGEIIAAKENKLPKLIEFKDIKGDLQVQTNWTDGKNSIFEMAQVALKAGLDYIAITDHTQRLAMTHGLDEKRIVRQWKEIDEANKKIKSQNNKFKILKGTECDILPDGSLDLPDNILSKLDVVGISVHSKFNMSRKDQTERIKKAMSNPYTHILFHPTGRILESREPYELDIEEIIAHAKKTGTVLEIDAYPDRSDLKDEYIKKCVNARVKMAIDSDAHSTNHFYFLQFGILQARRGWAGNNDIINSQTCDKMLGLLK